MIIKEEARKGYGESSRRDNPTTDGIRRRMEVKEIAEKGRENERTTKTREAKKIRVLGHCKKRRNVKQVSVERRTEKRRKVRRKSEERKIEREKPFVTQVYVRRRKTATEKEKGTSM